MVVKVKGDIMVKINMNGENIIDEEMIFSLKSGSTTVANLSPYTGLLDVISSLGVDLGLREQNIVDFLVNYFPPLEHQLKRELK